MRDTDGSPVRPVSRVKGRASIERSLRRLIIRTNRFAQHRATSADDCAWCARTLDALTAALAGQAQRVDSLVLSVDAAQQVVVDVPDPQRGVHGSFSSSLTISEERPAAIHASPAKRCSLEDADGR